MNKSDRLSFLKAVPFFSSISIQMLSTINEQLQEINLESGETLFSEGDHGDAVYFIINGEMNIVKEGIIVLSRIGGELVGEMALIGDRPRSATVTAATKATLLRWGGKAFQLTIRNQIAITTGILQSINAKLQDDFDRQIKSHILHRKDQPDSDKAPLMRGRPEGFRDAIKQSLGRYNVIETIGQGAHGIVYKCKDPIINRFVAIKTLKLESDVEANRKALLRFRREAKAASRLLHSNIVTVYDIGEQDGRPFIAMEYIDGESLFSLMRKNRTKLKTDLVPIIEQIAQALDYAHEQKVIHRDVKPGNVMIDRDNRVILIDFSIALLNDPQFGTLTTKGAMIGTPFYMSPEQVMGLKVTKQSDLFSFAVMVYELITGGLPFVGVNTASYIFNVVKEAPLPHQKLLALQKNPAAWERTFDIALRKDHKKRFLTCGNFIEALKNEYKLGPSPAGIKVFTDVKDKTALIDKNPPEKRGSGLDKSVNSFPPSEAPISGMSKIDGTRESISSSKRIKKTENEGTIGDRPDTFLVDDVKNKGRITLKKKKWWPQKIADKYSK
jgi:serine/threonine protein kinase